MFNPSELAELERLVAQLVTSGKLDETTDPQLAAAIVLDEMQKFVTLSERYMTLPPAARQTFNRVVLACTN